MKRPLVIAVLGALIGFGGWTWLTGPGTSVANAFLALLCAILCGRAAWWIAARGIPEDDAPEQPTPAATAPPGSSQPRSAAPPAGRRAPPPVDPEPWRRPDSGG